MKMLFGILIFFVFHLNEVKSGECTTCCACCTCCTGCCNNSEFSTCGTDAGSNGQYECSAGGEGTVDDLSKCKGDRVNWSSGWNGGCETYAIGENNHGKCNVDMDNGLLAAEVCHECGQCTGMGDLPTCQGDRNEWESRGDTCETYAIGQKNYDDCRVDKDDGFYAYEVCIECGLCTQGGCWYHNVYYDSDRDTIGKKFKVTSSYQCMKECDLNRECKFFSYDIEDYECELKKSDNGATVREQWVSGDMKCVYRRGLLEAGEETTGVPDGTTETKTDTTRESTDRTTPYLTTGEPRTDGPRTTTFPDPSTDDGSEYTPTFHLIEFSQYNVDRNLVNSYTTVQPDVVFEYLKGCHPVNDFLDLYDKMCARNGCSETRSIVEERLLRQQTHEMCIHEPGTQENMSTSLTLPTKQEDEKQETCEDKVEPAVWGTIVAILVVSAVINLVLGINCLFCTSDEASDKPYHKL